jgi:hypothetical protein
MLCLRVFRLRSSLNLTLIYEACSVSSCFMNCFHCFGIINGCLVNGSSPFLIKSHLSWNLNCLHALAVVFQKSLNACSFASSWNFKCFCTCLPNKSHFSSLLSSLNYGKCKYIFCLATSPASALNLHFWVNGTSIPLCWPQWLSLCHLATLWMSLQLCLNAEPHSPGLVVH